MFKFSIRPIKTSDKDWIKKIISEHWGNNIVVSHGIIYYPHELPGFIAVKGKKKLGLITYNISKGSCEIITLNSLQQSLGVGTRLIKMVEKTAYQANCSRLWLVTTNDNLNALRFYQTRGFEIVAVHRNALKYSRKLKPEIPLIGLNGIPLRDEIELEKDLSCLS